MKDLQLNIRCDESFKAAMLLDCALVDDKATFEISNAAIMRSALRIGMSVLKDHPGYILDLEKNGGQ